MIPSCSYSRLLLLFSVEILCHAATLTEQRSGTSTVDAHDPGHIVTPDENLHFHIENAFEQRLPLTQLDRILQALDPPPNCTSPETTRRFETIEPTPQHHNRLECFLWNLDVAIPKQSFEKDWITITVQDMVCTNFRLRGLRSNSSAVPLAAAQAAARLSNRGHDLSTLQISVNSISATCQGRYHLTGGLAGNVHATVEESMPPSPALDVLIGVKSKQVSDSKHNSNKTSEEVKVPSTFQTLQCGTHLGCQSIRFSGSISAKMIQAFSGMIGGHITETLQQQICPLMTKTVDPMITEYFKEFDDTIQKYLDEAVSIADVGVKNSDASYTTASNHDERNGTKHKIKDIVEFPTIHWILSFLNEQLRYHLQKSWIPVPNTHSGKYLRMSPECIDSFRGISGWVKSMLGSRPHIQLPQSLQQFSVPFPKEIGFNGTVTLEIPELIVEGLDQMDTLQILEPSSVESKDLQTKLISHQGFFVILPVKLEVHTPATLGQRLPGTEDFNHTPKLQESFRLTLNITHIDATLSSLIQVVDWESTTLLQVVDAIQRVVESHDLRDLACLFRTLHNVRVSEDGSWIFHNILVNSIRFSENKKDAPDGSLESDLDHTINNLLDLFLEDYSNLWTHLVRGFVRGPGSRSLNRFVDSWIHEHSISTEDFNGKSSGGQCPPVTSTPGNWVNFTKVEMLNKLNQYLDHSHTKQALNDFMLCLSESIEDAVDDFYFPAHRHISNNDRNSYDSDASTTVAPIVRADNLSSDSNLGLAASIADTLKDSVNLLIMNNSNNTETKIAISGIELRNWDSIQRLQVMKPSGDNSLSSSFVFGNKTSYKGTIDDGGTASNRISTLSAVVKGPPEIATVVDVEGYNFSGQINLTMFGGLLANSEISIDYDLHRLENLTISNLFEKLSCALLPIVQFRFLPGATLALGENFGTNITAVFDGRNFSLSTNDYPRVLEVSNGVLSWLQESSRTFANYVVESLIATSSSNCPGVVVPTDDRREKEDHEDVSIYWLYRESTILLIAFGFILLMQGGLFFLFRPMSQNDETPQDADQVNDTHGTENGSNTTPLLSSYQELNSHPPSQIVGRNRVEQNAIQDICEECNDNDESQGILEDQLVEQDVSISIFESNKTPEPIKYLVPAMIVGTIVLFISSNLSVGASVDFSVQLGQRSIGVPGLFQFSLGNTVLEMYLAGIYPLLILVVCFSGMWPYAKLLLMLYSWMRPATDPHRQERRLLTLDAMGKFSLVDIYVLILFVVAFRFQLGISADLGIDVYVNPMFGFFSFLFATCLSLILGHTSLFYHRVTMRHIHEETNSSTKTSILNHGFKLQNANSYKRFSCIAQILLLLLLISTTGLLIWGFLQESFTFQIGGLAGMMLGEGPSHTSYSVLSLGTALPSSVEDPLNPSIVILQATYFFFTMVTPILCLMLNVILVVTPLTLKWQRYILIATEVANSWSSVEVFLLSILAALFQISTFASFMIGDKCDEINELAKKVFVEEDTNTVCFTVDASVESNCWYLFFGAIANFIIVSFCLGFAETALDEKEEHSCVGQGNSSSPDISCVTRRVHRPIVQRLYDTPLIGCILFDSVPRCLPTPEEIDVPLEDESDGV